MKRGPLALAAYGLATSLAEPMLPWLIARRAGRGKEDPARQGERLGRASIPRPDGPLVWIHAASVGESLSHLPFVERLARERPQVTVLVTSGTRTSASLLARRLPAGAIHQYVPLDAPGPVRRFLEHWKPDLAVFVESEIWPNVIRAAAARGIRLALIGARISERSARRWRLVRPAAARVLGCFDLIWTQDGATRDWMQDIGVGVAGRLDLKRLAEPLPCDAEALAALRQAAGSRPVVVAASTHAGEEALVCEAASACAPRPLLIVAPRHPERGAEAARVMAEAGWTAARRAMGEPLSAGAQAYVADTLGELGLFYRLADVVVVGGSFLEGMSGHNPLEPARLRRPVITGPHTGAFAETYADLVAERAVLVARDGGDLAIALQALLNEPGIARALGERGYAACLRGAEAFDLVWSDLMDLLPA